MNPCSQSLPTLLKLTHITLFAAFLEAQLLDLKAEVTGYLRNDVTLPCTFIPGPMDARINQVQWDLQPPGGNKTRIIVFSSQHGPDVPASTLKGRVEITGQSLKIKDVKMTDAGSYTCSISTFPSGSFEGTAVLTVKEWIPLSSGVISAIVIAVMLLVGILVATAYLMFIRCGSPVRHHVCIDTDGPVMDVARRSVLRDEDVVYTDVKLKHSREATPSSEYKHTDNVHDGDVTYAEVVVLRQQPR